MTLTMDHVIIYVQDLQIAMESFREAGFTVSYGGQHADGNTENGLIIFADGSYFELIALVEGKTFADAGFKPLLKENGEGYTGFALQSDDIEADLQAMAERGAVVGEVHTGGRARPDGAQLQWKTAQIGNGMSPFIIQDLTDRNLRVPVTPEHTTHRNGVTGIHEVLIHVTSLDDAVAHYGTIVGTPLRKFGAARFEVGSSALVITQSDNATPAPVQVTLYSDAEDMLRLDLHSAPIALI